MRFYYITIGILSFLMISSTALVVFEQNSKKASKKDEIYFRTLIEDFKLKNQSKRQIDLTRVYPLYEQKTLFQPLSIYMKDFLIVKIKDFSNQSRSQNCNGVKTNEAQIAKKIRVWEENTCQLNTGLPSDFFEKAPYIHPSGQSYAFLAYSLKPEVFAKKHWLEKNIYYFHVSELNQLPIDHLNVEPELLFLASFKELEILDVLNDKNILLKKDKIYFKSNSSFNDSLVFNEYSQVTFSNFLNGHSYYLEKYDNAKKCFYQMGDLCVKRDFSNVINTFGKTSVVIVIGLFLSIMSILIIVIKRIKKEKIESENKKIALQTLTHELRTPVTNLVLSAEKLNHFYSELDREVQKICPVLTGEIYRLQRLTEESVKYLKSDFSSQVVDLKSEKINSINDFVLSHIEQEGASKIIFKGLSQDKCFTCDIYWLGLCIKNLIRNAQTHGVAPISLELDNSEKNSLKITVSDSGRCLGKNIEQMTTAFYKSNSSDGLGLGLHLVNKVVQEMQGELLFQDQPTSFTMRLRDLK